MRLLTSYYKYAWFFGATHKYPLSILFACNLRASRFNLDGNASFVFSIDHLLLKNAIYPVKGIIYVFCELSM